MPQKRRVVSEKTLELNVTAEILQVVRAVLGCEGAYWIGMKQSQENTNGIDELIANAKPGFHLVLQFKSAWAEPKGPNYRFSVSDDQLSNLKRRSFGRRRRKRIARVQTLIVEIEREIAAHLVGAWLGQNIDTA